VPPTDPMTPQRLREIADHHVKSCCPDPQYACGDCTDEADELRAHADQIERNGEDADKVKAFNLLLTAVNPTVRMMAQRYLEGVKDYEAFVEYLRKQPKPVPLQDADIDEDCR